MLGSQSLRRYLCQQFLMMMHLEIHLFGQWGLPILAKQILNQTDLIINAAYILEQACEDRDYLSEICRLLQNWVVI